MNDQFIREIYNSLKKRKNKNINQSYTAYLINNPELLGKKIGEESSELIIDFIKKNKDGVINESADLIYHILVIWVSIGIDPKEVWEELSNRQLKSGFEEKNSRS
ncbi:phosphoribosyl-ATP diphosphatase [Alphaproteobacteria bacterium]|nr:phosphoribosyl-ATP diphosphatase [Alphaproteobacteria bacterium]